jgi:peptidoglycan endopeptidase LytE
VTGNFFDLNFIFAVVLYEMEVSMNHKKLLQSFVIVAMLLAMFASTGSAFAAGCGTSVTVVSGDTLRKIADRCGTSVAALRLANPEIGWGDLIYPNQVLLLPSVILYGNNGYDTYIVARGDTMKSLAIRFGTTVDILLSLNKSVTNVNLIYEGQRMVVPSGRGVPVPPPPTDPVGQTYYVQKGDTLRIIASRFTTTVDEILKLNPKITNPNLIYVGRAITIPAGVSTYLVQKGDTLRIIASKFGATVDKLIVLNPKITNPNLIYVGQVINVR